MIFPNLFSSKRHVQFNPQLVLKKFSKTEAPVILTKSPAMSVVVSPHDDFAFPMNGGKRKRLRKSPAVRKVWSS